MYPCAHCGQMLSGQNVQTPRGWMHAHCSAAAFPATARPAQSASTPPIVWGVVALVVGGLFTLGLASGRSSNAPAPLARSAAEPADAPIYVTATALWNAYEANEVAADDEYKGRKIRVNGTIESIDKNFTDDIVVRLGSPNPFMPVDATLSGSEKARAKTASKGATVNLECRGRGAIIGRPQLAGCTFRD